jgi:tetratricopeptide (TPR) repeat protein
MSPPEPEVRELYNKAIRSIEYVVEHRGPDAPPDYVRNTIAAYVQLGDYDRALEAGNRGQRYFPRDGQIRARMSEAYQRRGDIPDAIRTMREAIELDPELPDGRARMAQMLLSNRQADEAIEWINRAAAAGEQSPDALATMLFGYGWNEGTQKQDFNLGVRLMEAAKGVEGVSPTLRSQLDFFHGYTLYAGADAVLRTTANLQTCRQQVTRLDEAVRVLPGGRAYAQANGQNLQSVLDAATQYAEMCRAIIERDG